MLWLTVVLLLPAVAVCQPHAIEEGHGEPITAWSYVPKRLPTQGWYIHPSMSRFRAAGLKHNTDKVSTHNYETMYGRLFELHAGYRRTHKLLEIGLGCDMSYGPGHSATLWREYLPKTEIWFGEYNAKCVEAHKDRLRDMGIKGIVTGDQANISTLHRWVNETGGNFDVIIDDGGHTNMQIFNSFTVLFDKALKPGGVYVIEDILACYHGAYVDGDKRHQTVDVVTGWISDLIMSRVGRYTKPPVTHPKPRRLKAIDCQVHACAFTKCYDDDPFC